MFQNCGCHPNRIRQCSRPQVDPSNARGECSVQRNFVANSTRQLNRQRTGKFVYDAAQNISVVTPAKRGVKIDEVQPLGALIEKIARRIEWVAVCCLGAGLTAG